MSVVGFSCPRCGRGSYDDSQAKTHAIECDPSYPTYWRKELLIVDRVTQERLEAEKEGAS